MELLSACKGWTSAQDAPGKVFPNRAGAADEETKCFPEKAEPDDLAACVGGWENLTGYNLTMICDRFGPYPGLMGAHNQPEDEPNDAYPGTGREFDNAFFQKGKSR